MKKFLMTIALTSVLSVSALAGEMPTVGAPAPAGTALAGDMPTCGAPAPASSGTQSSAAVAVLLTIISLAVR